MDKAKPLGITYYGGKLGRGLNYILPLVNSFPYKTTYVEPFFGMGGVFFNKKKISAEVINDLDEEIINLFKVLRDDGERLIEKVFLTPYSRREYDIASDREGLDNMERARRLLVKIGQGVLSHHNTSAWSRSVSYARSPRLRVWESFPVALQEMLVKLKHAQIECKDGLELIEEYDHENVLFYLDPPYVGETRKKHSAVYSLETSEEFEDRFCDAVLSIEKAKFILSGYDNSLYSERFSDKFMKKQFEDYTTSVKGNRGRRVEVIWTNIDTSKVFIGGG